MKKASSFLTKILKTKAFSLLILLIYHSLGRRTYFFRRYPLIPARHFFVAKWMPINLMELRTSELDERRYD
jgi:hypothetical protein